MRNNLLSLISLTKEPHKKHFKYKVSYGEHKTKPQIVRENGSGMGG